MSLRKIIFITFMMFVVVFPADFKECGTGESLSREEIRLRLSEYNNTRTDHFIRTDRNVLWVPVTFHILRNDNGTGGLPEYRIEMGLDDLNDMYAGTGMQFYQFGEIDYIDSTQFYTGIDSYEEINALRNINNNPNTANVYSVENLNNGNYDLCGIATFSWYQSQGIIMANSCFATPDNHTTLSHEFGHYFDLFHTHQGSSDPDGDGVIDGLNAEFVDGTECWERGDGFCDTPADPDLSSVVTNDCTYFGNYVDGHGDTYNPDTHNVMSYSVKQCRDFFSPEQEDKIVFTYETVRPQLNIPPLLPGLHVTNHSFTESEGDGDGVINPGERADFWVTLENRPDWPDAREVDVSLSTTDSGVDIFNGTFSSSLVTSGDTLSNQNMPFQLQFQEDAELGQYIFRITVTALGDEDVFFERSFDFTMELTLFQKGWPVSVLSDTLNQIKGAPVVLNTEFAGFPEIFFADYNGNVFSADGLGNPLENELFPFSAGDDIWGDIAAADIDLDGSVEIVIASKDKYLYILDRDSQTLQLSLNTGQFLISAPALGDVDGDEELEIVFGGFSSSGKIFCINPDGSPVPGFPVNLNEKIRGGVALADFNGNGKLDILCGTESNNLWLIGDDGVVAEGFPFTTDDKFKTAPVVLEINDTPIILAGNENGNFYAVDGEGSLVFQVAAEMGISTSAGLVELPGGPAIFFGSTDGKVYGITPEGFVLSGWPVDTGAEVTASPVFADLDSDGIPEIITANAAGKLLVYRAGGETYPHFPIHYEFQFLSAPTVTDVDDDGDLEIFIGSTHSVVAVDVKEPGNLQEQWVTFQGSYLRTGYLGVQNNGECGAPLNGDLNCDGYQDILDIVRLVNIILYPDIAQPSGYELWASDLNSDEFIDILDAVILVNLILN